MPWAHARLEIEEVVEVARLTHGRSQATRCGARLRELNRLNAAGWRDVVGRSGLEVLDLQVAHSEFAEQLLAEFPEVERTLLPGVQRDDLVTSALGFTLLRA
jgi:hypothetical protein